MGSISNIACPCLVEVSFFLNLHFNQFLTIWPLHNCSDVSRTFHFIWQWKELSAAQFSSLLKCKFLKHKLFLDFIHSFIIESAFNKQYLSTWLCKVNLFYGNCFELMSTVSMCKTHWPLGKCYILSAVGIKTSISLKLQI